jgi:hypothetical protein
MTLLMIAQFRAAPDAFVNRTAGGEGEMMMSSLGKVRTAGPFSFVIGVAAYFALATGYLVWAVLRLGTFKNRILIASGLALVIGIAVSGSRSVVGACAVVVGSLLLVILVRPDVINRFGQVLIVIFILGVVVSRLPIFREGFDVLSMRFSEVAEATNQTVTQGLISRVASSFVEPWLFLVKAPLFGWGLGIGTNAGAKFLTGHAMFLFSEGEWARVFLESGPLLGLAYILWRCLFAAKVGWLCVKSVRMGNLLPLLLFTSAFLPMINGQFGQPTLLGFTVFVMGLALAALNAEESATAVPTPVDSRRIKVPARTRGRSAYAERMHGPPAEHDHTNGSADR